MAKLVSKVYGDALFEAAMERDMLSPVYEEVKSLQTILTGECRPCTIFEPSADHKRREVKGRGKYL